MLTEKKHDVLESRTDCMNRVNTYANEVVPKLLDELRHGFRLTTGFQLYSKDKDRLVDILRIADEQGILSDGSTGVRGSNASLRVDEYNIYLEISDNYPVKYHSDGSRGYTCEYYKVMVYLWNNREGRPCNYPPREMVDYTEMKAAKARLEEIHDLISSLKDELYPLQRLTGCQR